jgi:CHASE3 domain sensor protein
MEEQKQKLEELAKSAGQLAPLWLDEEWSREYENAIGAVISLAITMPREMIDRYRARLARAMKITLRDFNSLLAAELKSVAKARNMGNQDHAQSHFEPVAASQELGIAQVNHIFRRGYRSGLLAGFWVGLVLFVVQLIVIFLSNRNTAENARGGRQPNR